LKRQISEKNRNSLKKPPIREYTGPRKPGKEEEGATLKRVKRKGCLKRRGSEIERGGVRIAGCCPGRNVRARMAGRKSQE